MEATQQFLQEKRARELRDEMERGYAEMATINFAIACECTHVEAEAEDRNISILGG
ncbi:'toxin-antitoxin system, antitoxin component' [Listeria ivanovii FSL F6-596]|nr:'toxin-antitoxin system, antitoxin component' [Listeria ivanovii FSL F6-596]